MSAQQARVYSLPDYYLTSIVVGARCLKSRYVREAAGRIVNPLSYPRYMEYRLALDGLAPFDGLRVLDVGSPKLPALLIGQNAATELYATDIRDYFIGPTSHFLRKLGHGDRIGRNVHLQVQDARHLSYPDAFFDRIFSISVIEHIPNSGDSDALRELARVLKPGGMLSLTVPFHDAGYYEEFVEGDVYERSAQHGGTFYQRHYDMSSLMARVIGPSGLQVDDITWFGEPGVRFERYWNRISMRWKLPLLWAQPFLANVFLKRLTAEQRGAAVGVAVRLTRAAESAA
jgi:SAM-dependent methyltransferase